MKTCLTLVSVFLFPLISIAEDNVSEKYVRCLEEVNSLKLSQATIVVAETAWDATCGDAVEKQCNSLKGKLTSYFRVSNGVCAAICNVPLAGAQGDK